MNNIPIGKKAPDEVKAIIEIAAQSRPVKYEYDKKLGAFAVDRFLSTSMRYPANYGYIPQTLGGDGDPLDILVVSPHPVARGSVVAVRPIGVLMMEDQAGKDEKILAVPVTKLSKDYKDIKSYKDLPESVCDQIRHFFEHYKDLEKGKWVKVEGWEGAEKAKIIIKESMARVQKKSVSRAAEKIMQQRESQSNDIAR